MQDAFTETFRGEHFLGILLSIWTIYDQNSFLLQQKKGHVTHFTLGHEASLTFKAYSLSPGKIHLAPFPVKWHT